eukprot:4201616-Pyramimonas_sp.AAC.1
MQLAPAPPSEYNGTSSATPTCWPYSGSPRRSGLPALDDPPQGGAVERTVAAGQCRRHHPPHHSHASVAVGETHPIDESDQERS